PVDHPGVECSIATRDHSRVPVLVGPAPCPCKTDFPAAAITRRILRRARLSDEVLLPHRLIGQTRGPKLCDPLKKLVFSDRNNKMVTCGDGSRHVHWENFGDRSE